MELCHGIEAGWIRTDVQDLDVATPFVCVLVRPGFADDEKLRAGLERSPPIGCCRAGTSELPAFPVSS